MTHRTFAVPVDDAFAQLARRAFPSYAGKKFQLTVRDTPMSLISHWSGGSRSYFQIVARNGDSLNVPQNGTPFDHVDMERDAPSMPAPGYVVVEHCISQGHDLGLIVHIHTADFKPTALPMVTLTDAERKVLEITRSYISSYRDDARRNAGLSRAQYDDAKASLIARKLLAKNGAITLDGKNAIA